MNGYQTEYPTLAQINQQLPIAVRSDRPMYADNFGQMRDYAYGFHAHQTDFIVRPNEWEMYQNGRWELTEDAVKRIQRQTGIDGMPFAEVSPSRGAIAHMITMLAPKTGLNIQYLWESIPAWLATENLIYWTERGGNEQKDLTYRMFSVDGETIVRAVASDKFTLTLDNYDLIEAMAGMKRTDGTPMFRDEMKLYRSYVSRGKMRLQLPVSRNVQLVDRPDGSASVYAVGYVMTNGEERNGAVRGRFYIQRHECQNSIYFPGYPEVVEAHYGRRSPFMVVGKFVEMMNTFIKDGDREYNFESLIRQLEEAAAERMSADKIVDTVGEFVSKFSLPEEEKEAMNAHIAEYAPTRLGVAQGITQYAQTLEAKKCDEMELAAGFFLKAMSINRQYEEVE